MGVRIPTGFKELQLTAQRKGLIGYRCTKCGKMQLKEMCFKTTSFAQYHVFGGEKARMEAENTVHQMAIERLDIKDNELFDAINVQQDYSKIQEPVICPSCGEQQIWSTIPKPWTDWCFGLWIIGMFFSGMLSFYVFALGGWVGLIPLFFFILFLALFLLYKRKRKYVLKVIQEQNFQPPKYYNHINMHELVNLENFDIFLKQSGKSNI